MYKIIALLGLIALATTAGCMDIKADASDFGRTYDNSSYTPPPNPETDPRGLADLQRENAQLRRQIADQERQHNEWQSVLDERESQIKALKRERDDLKKQRDHAKKALED